MRNYYEILNIAPGAEAVVIEGAYKALLRRYHPDVATVDRNEAKRRTNEITEAYRTLNDPQARARYDAKLSQAPFDAASSVGMPAPPTLRPLPRRGSGFGAGLMSAAFGGLAILVLIGALGSLGGSVPAETIADPAAPPPANDAPARPVADAEAVPTPVEPERANTSPSFDCDRAENDTQRTVCAHEGLAEADNRMASTYREAMAATSDRDTLKREQFAWLERRDALDADVAVLLQVYEDRIAALRRQVDSEPIF